MVEHVRVRNEGAGPQSPDVKPEVTAAHAHSRPLKLLQGSHVAEGGVKIADNPVVALYRLVSLFDLETENNK